MTTMVVALLAGFYFNINPVNWLWPGKMTTGVVSLSWQGRCLDLTDNSATVGTHLQVYPCDNSKPNSAQQWSFSDGRIIHRDAVGREFCVDIPDNVRSNGNNLQIWTCAGVGFPQQAFKYSGDLIMTQDGKTCLSVADDGSKVQLWDCARFDSSQKWTMTALASSGFLSKLRTPWYNFSHVLPQLV